MLLERGSAAKSQMLYSWGSSFLLVPGKKEVPGERDILGERENSRVIQTAQIRGEQDLKTCF